eukprot:6972391-Lingulodinium_polyedra.AAC.1
MDASDPDFKKRLALQFLASHGVATELAADAVSSTWRLTPSGMERIRIMRSLLLEGKALRPRAGVGPREA